MQKIKNYFINNKTNIDDNKIETKSFNRNATVYTPALEYNTNIFSQYNSLNVLNQIKYNPTILKIIERQLAITSSLFIEAKESKDGTDVLSTNEAVNTFLSALKNPNKNPTPKNWQQLLSMLYKQYALTGITGFIMRFNGETTQDEFIDIEVASSIVAQNNIMAGRVEYNVMLCSINNTIIFLKNPETGLFQHQYQDRDNQVCTMVLCSIENYDIFEKRHVSMFESVYQYIKLQNEVVTKTTAFFENASVPASILNITSPDGVRITPEEAEHTKRVLQNELQGTRNANKTIVTVGDHTMDFKVMSQPSTADDYVKYQNSLTQEIYSFVDGGSKSAFEGETEYSNNASIKLKDLYDGSIRTIKNSILINIEIFMKKLLHDEKNIDNIYLSFNTSNIDVYTNTQMNVITSLKEKEIITANETRQILTDLFPEKLGELKDIVNGDQLGQPKQNNTTTSLTNANKTL